MRTSAPAETYFTTARQTWYVANAILAIAAPHRSMILQSWLFGGPSAHIDLQVNSVEGRKPKYVDYGEGAAPVACSVFEGEEDITGTVEVHVPAGKSMEHQGIVVSLRGVIGEDPKQSRILLSKAHWCRFRRVLLRPKQPA